MKRTSIVALLVSVPLAARAEPMVTSYYPAKQPHIAAHRTLPMGTVLMLTNPRNGRSARVVIGTRGPFDRHRSLDVSHTVARQLGFERAGVVRLDARVVGR
jgi:rare lipoprotein A